MISIYLNNKGTQKFGNFVKKSGGSILCKGIISEGPKGNTFHFDSGNELIYISQKQ